MWYYRRPKTNWGKIALQIALPVAGVLLFKALQRQFKPANIQHAKKYGMQVTRAPRRVLAVTSHADDLEIFATGTLRKLALAGSQITVVVASDGNRQNNRSNAAQIRQAEQRDAGVIVGYDDIRYLGLGDINLSTATSLEEGLAEIWQDVDPDLVLAYDPSYPAQWINHPDHLAIGRAVLNINRTDWGHSAEVLFYGTKDPNTVVDITPVLEDKVQAMLAHRSQLKTFPLLYVALIRGLARFAGRPNQLAYAETFRCLSMSPIERVTEGAVWDRQSIQDPEHDSLHGHHHVQN